MEPKIDLSVEAIYKEKFEKDVKGYNAEQVDAFLDRIIRDYASFEQLLKGKEAQVISLEGEIKRLRESFENGAKQAGLDYERFRKLEVENASMRKKLNSIKPGDSPSEENLSYIQRIHDLESFIAAIGYDPKNLKKKID